MTLTHTHFACARHIQYDITDSFPWIKNARLYLRKFAEDNEYIIVAIYNRDLRTNEEVLTSSVEATSRFLAENIKDEIALKLSDKTLPIFYVKVFGEHNARVIDGSFVMQQARNSELARSIDRPRSENDRHIEQLKELAAKFSFSQDENTWMNSFYVLNDNGLVESWHLNGSISPLAIRNLARTVDDSISIPLPLRTR